MTKFFLPTIQRKKILEDAIKGRAPKELFYGMIDNNVEDTMHMIYHNPKLYHKKYIILCLKSE